jgi:tRNA A37 threonylcarbamoyladenosine dehydratase
MISTKDYSRTTTITAIGWVLIISVLFFIQLSKSFVIVDRYPSRPQAVKTTTRKGWQKNMNDNPSHLSSSSSNLQALHGVHSIAHNESESVFRTVEVSSELSNENNRNLRFAGVGRLYTTTLLSSSSSSSIVSNNVDDDVVVTTPTQQSRHIQVIDRLEMSCVVVVGLGGVGSWAAEALCRSGVGNLVLIDLDDVCISNTNRQLHALSTSVGKMKIDVMKERLQLINPDCNIILIHDFVSMDNVDEILTSISPPVTACLDAIDGATSKTALIAACARHGIAVVTCGGSAGRTDPTQFVCEDLSRVTGDPLLSTCRKYLRRYHGFEEGTKFRGRKPHERKTPRKWKINAVFSTEPQKLLPNMESDDGNDVSSLRRCDGALGTACFVTGTAGFIAAGKIIEMIANDEILIPKKFRGNTSTNRMSNEAN